VIESFPYWFGYFTEKPWKFDGVCARGSWFRIRKAHGNRIPSVSDVPTERDRSLRTTITALLAANIDQPVLSIKYGR
jgi:hypothetical protein